MKPVFCSPVKGGAIIAPIQWLHFMVLHTRSFLLISTFHCCNHGFMAESGTEVREMYIVGPIRRCMKPLFCRPVTRGTIIAPIQWLHLWVLHTSSFLLISTLHWCNHGTLTKGSPEVREIYIVGPLRRSMKPVLYCFVTGGTIIAPIQLLHFWVLHTHSFHLISTFHWYNHGTLADSSPEVREIHIVCLKRRRMKPVFCRPVTGGTIIAPIQCYIYGFYTLVASF